MVTRLSGGLTPADGADPRTFPAIWNSTATDIESLQSSSVTYGTAITALQGSAVALGSAVDVIEAWDLDDLNDVTIGTAVSDGQVLAYSTAVSGWVNEDASGGGKILQVVSTTKTDTFSTSSTTLTDVTGLSVSITPASASNTVLVMVSVPWSHSSTNNSVITVTDGSNNVLLNATSPSNRTPSIIAMQNGNVASLNMASFSFVHSPATTSSFTYKVRCLTPANTFYVNRSDSDNDLSQLGRGIATITAMEVAA